MRITNPAVKLRSPLGGLLALVVGLALAAAPHSATAQDNGTWWDPDDPRIGLGAGLTDAETASWNMRHLVNSPRPDAFTNPDNPGDLNFANSDMGFQGNRVVVGNFAGFMIYDISDPANPQLEVQVVCPGGQGDVSIFGDLVFMSVEQARGRLDCGPQGTDGSVDPERFRGVRIFDISDIQNPVQVAAVQTCRGSHTHTLLDSPHDAENVYVYNSGSSFVRPGEELEGCVPERPEDDMDTSLFRIEVIQVPLSNPADARVVSEPRIFADEETGRLDAVQPTGRSRESNHCHDITIYPDLGLAAGACSGNGILLDITDPANPQRVDYVSDENFAYWHSSTFNNDGSTVIFTDEWGGGTSARCRAEDPVEWGANALFRMVDGEMEFASYYKLPVPQEATENCVAHNGSLVPVPGRDIKVQAWYQGGVSVFDFTDPENPFEIAYFDRGPIDADQLLTGGFWSTYWYNGYIYGTEIARGLDVFELEASEHLSENELAAARLVTFDEFNPQHQPTIEWPADVSVARAFLDQLERGEGMPADRIAEVRDALLVLEGEAEADAVHDGMRDLYRALRDEADDMADSERVRMLADAIHALAHEARHGSHP